MAASNYQARASDKHLFVSLALSGGRQQHVFPGDETLGTSAQRIMGPLRFDAQAWSARNHRSRIPYLLGPMCTILYFSDDLAKISGQWLTVPPHIRRGDTVQRRGPARIGD